MLQFETWLNLVTQARQRKTNTVWSHLYVESEKVELRKAEYRMVVAMGFGKICWRRDRLPAPVFLGFPCGSAGKESACHGGDLGLIPGLGRFPWRSERLPTPVFWPGEFHGLYTPWGHKESDTTEQLSLSLPWAGRQGEDVGGGVHSFSYAEQLNKFWRPNDRNINLMNNTALCTWNSLSCSFFNSVVSFIYFWLCWVFAAGQAFP